MKSMLIRPPIKQWQVARTMQTGPWWPETGGRPRSTEAVYLKIELSDLTIEPSVRKSH